MGVDYSYVVGFGIQLPESVVDILNEHEDGASEALWEIEYPEGIDCENVGDLMNGYNMSHLIVIRRLTKRFDLYNMPDEVHFFNDIRVKDQEYDDLCAFVEDTWGLTNVRPGFFAAGRIS